MVKLAMKTTNSALLHSLLLIMWAVFFSARLLSGRFHKALEGFEATYQFRSAAAARRLVFSNGKISTRAGTCESPEYEILFIDLFGSLHQLVKSSNDVLRLVFENKIDHSGNIYYLFKIGYLFGLIERSLQSLTLKIHPRRRAAENAGRA